MMIIGEHTLIAFRGFVRPRGWGRPPHVPRAEQSQSLLRALAPNKANFAPESVAPNKAILATETCAPNEANFAPYSVAPNKANSSISSRTFATGPMRRTKPILGSVAPRPGRC